MSFHPVLTLLMLALFVLLALSVGYRPERPAVGQLRRTLRTLRRLARRNPDRYGPALALHLRLLSLELVESGRPVQALVSAMMAVDLWRNLTVNHPKRFDQEFQDALALEDVLKDTVGFDSSTDLLRLAEAEEDALARGEPSVTISANAEEEESFRAFDRFALFVWQIALFIWILSVSALMGVRFFGN